MAEFVVLNPVEVRVLGSLVEKALTTPDYYPLSLNALTNACNQTSSREPVMSIDEASVARALDSLRDKRLAFVFDGAQSRVPRYGHKFAEFYGLSEAEVAALCVLLLRGPQTVGEVKGRTGRMREFAAISDVEAVLEALSARAPDPLVVRLPRQAGLKEQRFAHRLGGDPVPAAAAAPSAAAEAATLAVRAENERVARLEADVAALRQELADLGRRFDEFRRQLE